MKLKKKILYVCYPSSHNRAHNVTIEQNIKVLECLNYSVEKFQSYIRFFRFLLTILQWYSKIKNIDLVVILVDGESRFEFFSLLKILKPSLKIIWDYHGPPSEVLVQNSSLLNRLTVNLKVIKQYLFSRLIIGSICPTLELKQYLVNNYHIKNIGVFPSRVDTDYIDSITKKSKLSLYTYLFEKKFVILWSGQVSSPWQKIDVLEEIAEKVYKIDKNIVFIITGSSSLHEFQFTKNILLISNVNYDDNIMLMSRANICMALYTDTEKLTGIKFHFSPRKIVEYMYLKKIVIASDKKPIRRVIVHGHNGYIKDKPEEIVDLIRYLKNNPKEMTKVGVNAKQTILDSYDNVSLTKDFNNFLHKML